MATLTVTYAKAVPPLPPVQVGARLRRIANDILVVAGEIGDGGLGGVDVTMVLDDAAKTLTFAGGNLAAARVVQVG